MTLTDRFLTCSEEPTKGQHCEWLTGLAIAVGVGGAAAGVATHIKNLVDGVTPWENPQDWFTSELKSKGIGMGTAAATFGVGQGLGALSGALSGAGSGIGAGVESGVGSGVTSGTADGVLPSAVTDAVGSNIGTTAVEAGAPTPTSLGGMVTPDKANIISALKDGSAGVIKRMATNAISNGITGGIRDPEDFGRGALMGAAQGAASGLFSGTGDAVFRGQGAGIVPNSVNGPDRGFSMMGDAGGSFSRAYDPNTAASAFDGGFDKFMDTGSMGYDPGREAFSVSRTNIATPPPTLAERATGFGIKQGSNFAGSAARNMVGRAMAQMPEDPMSQNPYAQYGQTPYWMRRM